MGISSSCEAEAGAEAGVQPEAEAETAKLVLQDGELREFAGPVKAAQVVGREPACFVWDADDMVVCGFASAVGAEDELRPGKLYFLLPIAMLRRPLGTGEMAALAVRASGAVALCPCRCHRGEEKPPPAAQLPASKGGARRRSEKARDFTSHLSSIPE